VTDASGWIGHDALIESDFANRSTDGHYRGLVSLDKAATNVTIDFLDANGLILHSVDAGSSAASSLAFDWDGATGGTPASGAVKVRVLASNAGQSVATTTAVWTPITAVQSPAGTTPRLVTPNGLIAASEALALG